MVLTGIYNKVAGFLHAESALFDFIFDHGGQVGTDQLKDLDNQNPELKGIVGKLSQFCGCSNRLRYVKRESRPTVTLVCPNPQTSSTSEKMCVTEKVEQTSMAALVAERLLDDYDEHTNSRKNLNQKIRRIVIMEGWVPPHLKSVKGYVYRNKAHRRWRAQAWIADFLCTFAGADEILEPDVILTIATDLHKVNDDLHPYIHPEMSILMSLNKSGNRSLSVLIVESGSPTLT